MPDENRVVTPSPMEWIWIEFSVEHEEVIRKHLERAEFSYCTAREKGEAGPADLRVLDGLKKAHDNAVHRLSHLLNYCQGAKEKTR